jgi:hypothetical protein
MIGNGAPDARPWVAEIRAGRMPAPVVLVLGGFLTSPPLYRALSRDLRALGAADVVVANVWAMDWLLAPSRGLGAILTRSSRALLEASERSERLAGGAPVLVVGHSAGGVSARLLSSPVPYARRPLNGGSRIGAIVTLGTPHVVRLEAASRNRVGAAAAAFVNRAVPGAALAPRVGYLAVGSSKVVGRRQGSPGERRTWALYAGLVPFDPPDEIRGDGLIPIASSLLPGVPRLELDDAAHGQGIGRDWYGSPGILARWWPLALEAWTGALRARAEGWQGPAGTRPAGHPLTEPKTSGMV